ncbi:hypothetical protein SADUNF_Sadunf06G0107100 [Salix dunnii]|uniref:Uncharacterized protein n=1 Tax=Salix dunnii TaxID=1413687 RepID=A0A835MVD3_9ROSI|nr:hypothetical protein SADUNF_Sadunf06G0107100 [Salix dunnii]
MMICVEQSILEAQTCSAVEELKSVVAFQNVNLHALLYMGKRCSAESGAFAVII